MASTPLHQLNDLGQSPWLDSITREWLDSGELAKMVKQLAVTGVTSNPTIFAAALTSTAYDADIARLGDSGLDDHAIFEQLAVDDIRRACDVLAQVHERTDEVDGMVSLEVEPDLAHDTGRTIERGRQLWDAVGRPNLMIKVPATDAGLPAIEQLLVDGVNVNVTLLFGVDVYRQVMERYVSAMERRAAAGESPRVASVASFFVSRVDTKVDAALEQLDSDEARTLRGTIAVANAHAAWDAYLQVFGDGSGSGRWSALAAAGARPQRPLWASTGTKNPAYSDILYVQELIVPGSVNTMPLSTMHAFADHGQARPTISPAAIAVAHERLAQLAQLGIELDAITEQLRREGVDSFQASYEELLGSIADKRTQLAGV